MLTGRLVGLRPVLVRDLDFLADLSNAPGVRRNVVGWDWPVSRDGQRAWFDAAAGDPGSQRFTVLDRGSGEPIGLTGLWEIDWHNRSAAPAVKLMPGVAPKGAGTDSMMLIAAWAFYEVGLRRLHTTILQGNVASLAMCVRRCGWLVEGHERQAVFRAGAWQDLVRVALLRSDFDALDNAAEYVARVCGQTATPGQPPGPAAPGQPP